MPPALRQICCVKLAEWNLQREIFRVKYNDLIRAPLAAPASIAGSCEQRNIDLSALSIFQPFPN